VSPEEAGLFGCWQFIAVRRERVPLDKSKAPSIETGYYVTSVAADQLTTEQLSKAIRDHWSATENGTHYRRDVTFAEDQCRVRDRVGAEMLVVLRNLAIAVYELESDRGGTQAKSLRNWMKRQTFKNAHSWLKR
jgi:predicted transposase YbfD/YdcC